MRAPDELPRRRRRRTSSNRGRILLVVGGVALFILLTSLRGIAGFYTDYLWFDSLGQWGTRRTILGAQLTLAGIFVTAFFLMAWSNLYVAERLAPPFRPTGPEDELLERYHDLVAGRTGRIRVAVAGLLALIAGVGASAEWNEWLLFRHGGSFGVEDPQFGRDVGFYVFKLPFLAFVVDWLFASLLIVLIITAVEHYLNGGIRVQPPSPRVTPQVKAHLSVLVALLALVKAADYWLQQFELTVSTRGVVDGATYTDVNAQLPALRLLILISLAAAGLFVANIFRRGWALPIVAVALWGFVAVVVGGIYPQIVQNFTVTRGNELAKEGRYIERNIEATREALGVEGIESQEFMPETNPDNVDLASAQTTINNIRLWDPSMNLAGRAFNQLQRIRDYYAMNDIDVDRYMIDGQPTQIEIGVRNINEESIPNRSWESQHLAYTHGYGAVVAPVNASVGEEPDFVVSDIPVQDDGGGSELEVEQPGIYFGENLSGYAIVGASGREEIDYQLGGGETQRTTYEGEDGVGVGSFLRQAAFALRFGDPDMLLSGYLDGDSKAIYIRDVVDRVEMLAPFLEADHDPYPVVLDGEVKWVVDLYTTTSRYPYAERVDSDSLGEQNSLRFGLNYVRNSVKATVDAYDGTVNFYVMDPEDPIIDAYREALPDLFSDRSDMPDGLEDHLRYPEDLFEVQTWSWERYHLDTPSEFLDNNDRWRIARNPGTRTVEAGTATTDGNGSDSRDTNRPPTGSSDRRIPSFYQLMQLPGEEEAEFVLTRPFVPFSAGDSTQQLTAFMAARMDGENYGKLQVYEMPTDNLPDGPGLVFATISGNATVSDLETNLGVETGGSNVIYGNLLMVPVDQALLYVQPFYVEAAETDGSIPRLTYVIAVLGDQVVIEPTLQEALTSLFGQQVSTREDPGAPPPSGDDGTGEETAPPSGSAAEQAAAKLAEADALFAEADAALANRDLSLYEDKIADAREKVAEATALLSGDSPSTTTTTAPDDEATGTTDGSAAPRPA